MPSPQLFFVSGLPRSGSTLLLNLLAQNPAHHVTPTSGLIELFVAIKNRWPEFVEFKAEGLERVKPRVLRALKGLLHGYFDLELSANKAVFDKSRGWLQYIEPLEEALERRVKIIVTVRDLRGIVASFEKLYRRRSIDYREAGGEDFYRCQTVEGRARCLLGVKSVLGLAIARLRDVFARGLGSRLVILPYESLTARPQEALGLLHGALGLPHFDYDAENVQQITHENDLFHGMDLHRIRPKVEATEQACWESILPASLCQWIDEEYSDIQGIARTDNIVPAEAEDRWLDGIFAHA